MPAYDSIRTMVICMRKFTGKGRDSESGLDNFGSPVLRAGGRALTSETILTLFFPAVAYPLRFCFLQRVGHS